MERCLQQIRNPSQEVDLHVIDKINMTFRVHLSILPKVTSLTKIKVFGDLPLLRINFSDRKYKTLMSIVDLVVPKDPETVEAPPPPPKPKSSMNVGLRGKSNYQDELTLGETTEGDTDDEQRSPRRGKKVEDKDKVMF